MEYYLGEYISDKFDGGYHSSLNIRVIDQTWLWHFIHFKSHFFKLKPWNLIQLGFLLDYSTQVTGLTEYEYMHFWRFKKNAQMNMRACNDRGLVLLLTDEAFSNVFENSQGYY